MRKKEKEMGKGMGRENADAEESSGALEGGGRLHSPPLLVCTPSLDISGQITH